MSRPAPFTVLQPVTRTLANKARRIARKLVIFCNLSGVVQNGPASFEGGGGMRVREKLERRGGGGGRREGERKTKGRGERGRKKKGKEEREDKSCKDHKQLEQHKGVV